MSSDVPRGVANVPVTVIRPRSGLAPLDLRELGSFGELLYFFVWRDLKVRYKQTALGASWALLQPLALMLVFTLVLGGVPGLAPEGVPYSLFALAGLVVWTMFAQSLLGASSSLVNAANLVQKVFFPRILLPTSAVGSYMLDLLIGCVLLLGAVMLASWPLAPRVLFAIPMGALGVAAALAFGIWLSAVSVRYRDVRHAVPFLLQLWLFATPVAYSAAAIPEPFRILYFVNPMAGVVEGFRWAVLGLGEPPLLGILMSFLVTCVVPVGGLLYFRRVELTFADVI
jgi:lipopolysaccharide transport system permease protein